MWKWLIGTVLSFLIVAELVFFAPDQGDREVEKDWVTSEDEETEQDVEQVLSGTHLVEAQGEKKLWELEASEARKSKGCEDWRLDAVKVRFFGENSVFYNAIGKKGFVGENQKKLKVEGDIVITSSNGYVLNTELIYYTTDTRAIEGPEAVTLEGPPERNSKEGGPLYMEADRFDADLSTNVINLYDNVRGRKKMSGGRKMKIISDKAIFSGQSNYALFRDNVIIDVDSMTITGPRAKFRYKNKELHSMFIDGGVKIKDIGRWGVSGEAEVFFKEDKYIFRGNPKVVQGGDQLVGEEIIIYDGGDRVQVKKAKTKYKTKEDGEPGY